MAESSIQLVQRLFEAFSARDAEAMRPLLAEEIQYFAPDTAKLVGRNEPYVGVNGIQSYLRDIDRVWDEMRVLSLRFEPIESGVLVEGRIVTRTKTGLLVDAPAQWVVEVAGDRIVRATLFRDQAEARRAAGLGA
jgi:ketosteroid isomerase-like protein